MGGKGKSGLISIVVPVYRVEQYLNQCVESIVGQTYRDLEIILVDDGSPDGCPALCDAWAARDSRIRVVHKENGGVSSARNMGVDLARGQHVFFIDGDDYLDKNALKTLISHHDGRESTLVALDYDRVPAESAGSDPLPEDTEMPCQHLNRENVLDVVSVREGCYIWGMLIPKALIDKGHIRFPEKLRNLEDAAWIGMALYHAEDIICIKARLYHYRKNPISITSNCTDRSWQAAHWAKVYGTLVGHFSGCQTGAGQRRYIQKMLRYCKNNFFAECFAGGISFEDAKWLGMPEDDENGLEVKYPEYCFYNSALTVRRMIKKLKKP